MQKACNEAIAKKTKEGQRGITNAKNWRRRRNMSLHRDVYAAPPAAPTFWKKEKKMLKSAIYIREGERKWINMHAGIWNVATHRRTGIRTSTPYTYTQERLPLFLTYKREFDQGFFYPWVMSQKEFDSQSYVYHEACPENSTLFWIKGNWAKNRVPGSKLCQVLTSS